MERIYSNPIQQSKKTQGEIMATVKDWINYLERQNPSYQVIIASDTLATSYSILPEENAFEGTYTDDPILGVLVGITQLTPLLEAAGFTESDVRDNPCIVVFPPVIVPPA